jgi:hypothetical protein
MHLVEFVRLERVATDSWITLRLPYAMDMGTSEVDDYVAGTLPGWELVCGSDNPDGTEFVASDDAGT